MAEGSLRRQDASRVGPVPTKWSEPDQFLAADDKDCIDPSALEVDPDLVPRLPAAFLIEEQLLPWMRSGGVVVVLCASPRRSAVHRPRLVAAFGCEVRLARTDPAILDRTLQEVVGRPLARRAETLCPAGASCRSLSRMWCTGGAAVLGLGLLAAGLLWPISVLAALTGLAVLALVASTLLRLAALLTSARPGAPVDEAQVVPARLPVISLFLPLYRETEVAGTLLARLGALDYPRDRLEVLLIVEDDDRLTRKTLEGCLLPPWARIVEVPEGTIRTKPRALNYALQFARGSVIGIYDAEDVPAPDHLLRVAETFARRWPGTACLQGALDYFNHHSNWLARCFTLEYGSWFRVLLPGLERLGVALPLGGTTLFLRREALEAVGGWDAHNVTEDADLGIRLARRGYRTEMIPIATMEEANCRPWPWVRQRTRWLKGYAVTWAVHMRRPARLWRDLGPWRFLGFQVMFAGALFQLALAPLLWTAWLVPLGIPHPLSPILSDKPLQALSVLFFGCHVLDVICAGIGAWRSGKARLAIWAPSLMLYFPLATLAVYRALWELGRSPFLWDKTTHGIDQLIPVEDGTSPARLPKLPSPFGVRRAVTQPPEPSRRRA